MYRHNPQRGTTLIELMIYLAISTGVIIGIGSVGLSVLEQKQKAQTINDVRYAQDTLHALLSRDIREASVVVMPALGGVSTTTLTLASIFPERNPIVYSLEGGVLLRTVATGSPVVLLPEYLELRDVSFAHQGGGSPVVSVTARLQTQEGGLGNALDFEALFQLVATLRAPRP